MLAAVLAYLIGSIPFGYLTARLVRGIDIRQHGSGNIGATNVGRVMGNRWGLFVLVLDLFKGLLPVWLLPMWVIPTWLSTTWIVNGVSVRPHVEVAAGVMTIMGHMAPCWLGFRGGKGVATALGVVLYLAPVPSLIAAGAFAITFGVSRIVSVSSIVACLAFATVELIQLRPDPFAESKWPLATFSIAIPMLIIVRHRSNIGRLLRGEEPRYRSGAESQEATPPATQDGR
jgi:glycerol-3-phosphate acyltransferase PlsY